MLSNERFALACRAYYEEQGLVIDETNGEFAHCPQPERYGNTGYYLLHGHHQHQGLLQSRDIGECCFFVGHAKKWLLECDYFPDDYFELWDIYEKYASEHNRKNAKKLNEEKDELGRSVLAVKAGTEGGKKTHEEKDESGKSVHAVRWGIKAAKLLHEEKDELGRSVQGVRSAERLHAEKDELGRSVQGVKNAERLHAEKDELGRSVRAVRSMRRIHAEKDELGRSVNSMKNIKKVHAEKDEFGRSLNAVKSMEKLNAQIWESTIDGFRGRSGNVAYHNKSRGWDPNARIRIS